MFILISSSGTHHPEFIIVVKVIKFIKKCYFCIINQLNILLKIKNIRSLQTYNGKKHTKLD